MSWLPRILEAKRDEIARLPARAEGPYVGRQALDVLEALARPAGAPLRLITEVKRRSPSAGPLSTVLDPGARAVAYAESGARAVSVLCDAPFFDGGFPHVAEARRALDAAGLAVPVLAKEFVLDPRQIDQAAAHGADLVLLVVRIVDAATLRALVQASRGRGLEPLVEVATEDEVDVALAAGAKLVGVNARDLDTLTMDAARAARVLARIPEGVVRAHLSGVKTPDDVRALAAAGVDAALVGETLMRADDPRPILAGLVAAG